MCAVVYSRRDAQSSAWCTVCLFSQAVTFILLLWNRDEVDNLPPRVQVRVWVGVGCALHHLPGQLEHVHTAGRGDQHRVRPHQRHLPAQERLPGLQVGVIA